MLSTAWLAVVARLGAWRGNLPVGLILLGRTGWLEEGLGSSCESDCFREREGAACAPRKGIISPVRFLPRGCVRRTSHASCWGLWGLGVDPKALYAGIWYRGRSALSGPGLSCTP